MAARASRSRAQAGRTRDHQPHAAIPRQATAMVIVRVARDPNIRERQPAIRRLARSSVATHGRPRGATHAAPARRQDRAQYASADTVSLPAREPMAHMVSRLVDDLRNLTDPSAIA